MHIHFGGHSTLLIEIDGVKVLTDPLFREWLLHIKRHAPAIDMAVFGQPDVILISHSHLDHLDKQSLQRLDRGAHVIAPSDTVKIIRRLGFQHITAVKPGDTIETHGLKVITVPAIHGGGRLPWSAEGDMLGFIVESGLAGSAKDGSALDDGLGAAPQSFYFAGDTDLYPAMDQLAKLTQSGIDLALLPVWGWGPKVGEGHLDPTSAAEAAKLVNAWVTVPIHWGGYFPFGLKRTHGRLLSTPPREFAMIVERMSLPTKVRIVDPGKSISLDRGEGRTTADVESKLP